MEIFLRWAPLLGLFGLGTLLAYRWVVSPSEAGRRYPRGIRVAGLVLVCWMGAFVVGNVATRVAIAYFDPEDFPEDRGISAEVAYDGTGSNAVSLFMGWLVGPMCMGLAGCVGGQESDGGNDG